MVEFVVFVLLRFRLLLFKLSLRRNNLKCSPIPRSRFKTNVADEYQTDERGNEHKSIHFINTKLQKHVDNMRGRKKRNLISMKNTPKWTFDAYY